jgi:hypothetical protein
VGTVRSAVGNEAVLTSSIARLCSVRDFGVDLWRHACEGGSAFIADGSHWLWTLADRHFSRAIKIVDFWHGGEPLSVCARAFFGEGSEAARQWSLKVRGPLRAGDVQGVLREVEVLNPRASQKRREQKHSLVTYLTNNQAGGHAPAFGRPGAVVAGPSFA